jgi:cytochrome d ubiquinol oxidase subunit I
VLVAVYVLLGIVYLFLMLRYARRGLELEHADEPTGDSRTPAITY